MKQSDHSSAGTRNGEFEKFDDFARRIFAVPKEEFDAELAKQAEREKKKPAKESKKNGR